MTILVPAVIGAVITATMGGYAFARLRFRGKKFLFTLCVGSMLLPSMVTLIPLFVVWAKLGLVNTYWPLILPHFCGGGAFNIFLIRQFVKTCRENWMKPLPSTAADISVFWCTSSFRPSNLP